MLDINDILYEDNHIIVVNKRSGVLSQSDGSKDIDMITLIKKYLKEKYNKKGNVYLGLVHRLDRMVSGVMVFAKTSKAASRLSEQIRNRIFKKEYLCIAKGKFNNDKGILENYIKKDEKRKLSFIANKDDGKKAILEYDIIRYSSKTNTSLVHILLHTGRFHQIRLQLSNISHPIIGDIKYGNIKYKNRVLLHAYKIQFMHPTKKIELTFSLVFDKKILEEFDLD